MNNLPTPQHKIEEIQVLAKRYTLREVAKIAGVGLSTAKKYAAQETLDRNKLLRGWK